MEKTINFLPRLYNFLKDDKVDIRIRMMYFVDIAVVTVCLLGGINLLLMGQSYMSVSPNLMLIVIALVSGYMAGVHHKYDFAAIIMIVGCADFVVPIMYFFAGGSNSGMPLIFLFGVVLVCLMATGKIRIFLLGLTLAEDIICMFVGHFHSSLIVPLEGENAGFYDLFQTFIFVGLGISIVVVVHLSTYDRQRQLLEKQREELYRCVNTDELTGVYNRHAYYDETSAIVSAVATNDIAIVTMDVNGLKMINDTLGHAEGDKYIQSAANTISAAYGEMGKIFRTGGDEFVAILHCNQSQYDGLIKRLKDEIKKTNDASGGELAIAAGAVYWNDHHELNLGELEKLADGRMYEDKRNYYMSSGRDRRRG